METFLFSLTPVERNLFLALTDTHAASRGELLHRVWGYPADTTDKIKTRTLDMAVSRLRKKAADHGYAIQSVRGYGYRLLTGV